MAENKSGRLFTGIMLITAFLLFACSTLSPQGTESQSTSAPGVDTAQESVSTLTTGEGSSATPSIVAAQSTGMPTETPPTETPSTYQDALIEMWRPAIGSLFLLNGICQGMKEIVVNQLNGASSSTEFSGEILSIRFFLGINEEAISEWAPESELEPYKADTQSHIDSLQNILDQWEDGLLTNQQVSDQVSTVCDTSLSELEAMVKDANKMGLSKASMESIVEEMKSDVEEKQSEGEGEGEVIQTPSY